MKKFITPLTVFILVFFIVQISYSQATQEWVRTYGVTGGNFQDGINAMVVDGSGNAYVTGYTHSNNDHDFLTIKYNSEGGELWVRTYHAPDNIDKYFNEDMAEAIAIDSSGNVYVTGFSCLSYSEKEEHIDYATIKYDPNGAVLWVQRYHTLDINQLSRNYPTSIAVDNSGNVYVSGTTDSLLLASDLTTVKYNINGELQWVRRSNGAGVGNYHHEPVKMVINDSGCIYVSGTSPGQGSDYNTIKYNSTGEVLWVRTYDGGYNLNDLPKSITLDNNGNVIVSGKSFNGSTYECATVKYSSGGELIWSQKFNGHFDDGESDVAADNSGNIYVLGKKENFFEYSSDYVTLKYTESGILEWLRLHSGEEYNSMDVPVKIFVDNYDDIYVTGHEGSTPPFEPKITTIKYNTTGDEEWMQHFDGNLINMPKSLSVSSSGDVYVAGVTGNTYGDYDCVTIKYSQLLKPKVIKPEPYSKWISDEYDTIKWTGGIWDLVKVKCVLNSGTPAEEVKQLGLGYNDSVYVWHIPDTLLSYRTKIIVENFADTTLKVESGIFRIKPYILTRVNDDSTYHEFRKDRDQWGFKNDSIDIWPESWFRQFNYWGTDPFTNSPYPIAFGLFADSTDHMDWISFVTTFGTAACYKNLSQATYSPIALRRWSDIKGEWGGSCFGIATANAIVFRNRNEFASKYVEFPVYYQPIDVYSNDPVKKNINELFTHQYGKVHQRYTLDTGFNKTPTQTLNEIKAMLLSENDPVRALSIFNNGPGGGGHTINVYKVTRSFINPEKYYVSVYDNVYPNSNVDIIIDTSANTGNGSWEYSNLFGWGGTGKIFLEEPAINYLINPTITRPQKSQSPFSSSPDVLQVFNPLHADISIKDQNGNITGFINNEIHEDIPNSIPLIVKNGSEGPPYGYELATDNYSVTMNNFDSDKTHADFFTGNNVFTYERSDVTEAQTDNLFFDGGIYVKNPDEQTKEIKIGNIVNETSIEKVFSISSLELAQNDSVKIETSNELKLTSTGTAKNYDLDLNIASESGIETFTDSNIPLPANTSHTYVTDWSDIDHDDLIVLQDLGNNGTIDDTLTLKVFRNLELTVLLEGFFDPSKNNMVQDTVTVYLKNISPPFNNIDSAKSVLNQYGTGNFKFKAPEYKVPYYIVIKHRNSIETWSAEGQTFNSNYMYFDLTKYPYYAYGSNLKFKSYRYCMYGGDVNQDGVIDLNDVIQTYNAASSFAAGYIVTDNNGDNIVDLNDILIAYNNSAAFVAVVKP